MTRKRKNLVRRERSGGREAPRRCTGRAPSRCMGRDMVALLKSLPPVDADYLDEVEMVVRSQPRLPESPWEP